MKALGKVGMAVVLWFMLAPIHDMPGNFFTEIDGRRMGICMQVSAASGKGNMKRECLKMMN